MSTSARACAARRKIRSKRAGSFIPPASVPERSRCDRDSHIQTPTARCGRSLGPPALDAAGRIRWPGCARRGLPESDGGFLPGRNPSRAPRPLSRGRLRHRLRCPERRTDAPGLHARARSRPCPCRQPPEAGAWASPDSPAHHASRTRPCASWWQRSFSSSENGRNTQAPEQPGHWSRAGEPHPQEMRPPQAPTRRGNTRDRPASSFDALPRGCLRGRKFWKRPPGSEKGPGRVDARDRAPSRRRLPSWVAAPSMPAPCRPTKPMR